MTNYSIKFENYPWMIKIDSDIENGLSKVSAFDCFQVRNFSHSRFIKKVGNISQDKLLEVY